MKIRQVRAKLFHADDNADMTKLMVGFRSFANAPKILQGLECCNKLHG
jgi:hypothetical protein